jgi:hypothetical protein
MKKYISPVLQTVELRFEESIARVQTCNGACTEDVTYGDITYYAHGS